MVLADPDGIYIRIAEVPAGGVADITMPDGDPEPMIRDRSRLRCNISDQHGERGRYRTARFMLSCAKGRGVAHIAGAIDLVRGVDHRSDIQQRHAPLVQVVVNVVGDLLWLPTPSEVVADEVRLTDERLIRIGRPSKADSAQLCEVGVISGSGSRNRSATNQGSASHHGDGKSGQPAT